MTLKEAAAEVLTIIERGSYVSSEGRVDFLADQDAAVAGTRLFSPNELETVRHPRQRPTEQGEPGRLPTSILGLKQVDRDVVQ